MAAAALMRPAGLLEDEHNLHVLTMSVLLMEIFGTDYLTWSSEGLHDELVDRFGPVGVLTWERIQALRVLQGHNAYWVEWEVFEKITSAINGQVPIFNLSQPQDAEEIAISLSTAAKFDTHEFSQEVKDYIAASLLTDGLWYLESPLKEVAQESIDEHDRRYGIERDVGPVQAELEKSDKIRPSPRDHIDDQVNQVLDVREVLKRYSASVNKQLSELPGLLKGKKQ